MEAKGVNQKINYILIFILKVNLIYTLIVWFFFSRLSSYLFIMEMFNNMKYFL